MTTPRPPWLGPALATVAVLATGIAIAAIADRPADHDPARPAPAAADAAGAAREALVAAPGAKVTYPTGEAPLAGECSSYAEVPAPPGAPVPPKVALWRGVFAGFARPDDRRAVRGAVADLAGVTPAAVTCSEIAIAMADTPAAERSAAGADAAIAPAPAGSGSCVADHAPARPAGQPEGATLRISASGEYPRREDEGAVRAAVAAIAGVAPERVECSYYVPPIGFCQAELAPGPGDPQVPEGATASGFVSGDYTAREQVEGLRAALAAMAGLQPSDIVCEDHPAPVAIDPVPGGAETAPLPADVAEGAPAVR